MEKSIIKEMGYTWLAVPKSNILPLQLLEQRPQNLFAKLINKERIASAVTGDDIFSIFPTPKGKHIALSVNSPEHLPDFKGTDILKIKSLSTAKLKSVDPAIAKVLAKAKVDKIEQLFIRFKNVTSVQIHTTALLNDYINKIPPNKNLTGFIRKLNANKLYVITEVLQSNEFAIEGASEFKGNIGVTAALKKNAAQANIDLKKQKNILLNYKNSKPLTFAIKAVLIKHTTDKDKQKRYYTDPGILKLVKTRVKDQNDLLENDFINIH